MYATLSNAPETNIKCRRRRRIECHTVYYTYKVELTLNLMLNMKHLPCPHAGKWMFISSYR